MIEKERHLFIIYDILFILLAILYFPYLVWKGKWHKGFSERLGFISDAFVERIKGKKNIWIHAVSVGEVLAILDLIDRLKETLPEYRIVCSTVTKTGHKLAEEKLKDKAVVFYAPLDFSWIVRKFINVIAPKVYISTETEIWPNLYAFLKKNKVPLIQINGRISDKSYQGYKRVLFLTRKALACVTIFYMQSKLDAERVIQLGADPQRVKVIGNIKFDNLPVEGNERLVDFGFQPDHELLIAGSTHPGEEEVMLEIYQVLVQEFPQLRLIICPRHVERALEVEQLVKDKGLQAVMFSKIKGTITKEKIVVVDTIGQLRTLYGLAKIVFVGKSLIGSGGQNMIEPAFFAKPTFVGPHTYNFKDVMRIFLYENAIIQVQTKEELLSEMRDVLKNPVRLYAIGNAAKRIVRQYQGATTKTVGAIVELLRSKGQGSRGNSIV